MTNRCMLAYIYMHTTVHKVLRQNEKQKDALEKDTFSWISNTFVIEYQ